MKENKWIPISYKQPQENDYYLTTTVYKQVFIDHWIEDHFDRTEAIIAWQPLPEPYNSEVD